MVRQGGLARDYVATISGGVDEAHFLESIPWVIDAGTQEPGPLFRALGFDAARLAELPGPRAFSIIARLRGADPRLVEEMILSVRCQSWGRWELLLVVDEGPSDGTTSIARRWAGRDPRIECIPFDRGRGLADARERAIERSSGDFLAFLEPDAVLHPSALGTFARRLNCDRDANLIFSNEAAIDEGSGRIHGYFTKPPFDPFTLLRFDCMGHLAAIRRDLLTAAARDGRACRPGYDGVEDHELTLRLASTGRVRPAHLPLFLCYRRTSPIPPPGGPGAVGRRLRLVGEMASEFYPGWRPEVAPPVAGSPRVGPSVRLRPAPGRPRPSLLVVVPFKDHVDQTLRCVESIERQEHDLDARVVLVDNRSAEAETARALRDWVDRPRRCRYEVLEHDGPFNYARINNEVVRRLGRDSDLILFLNNDVELVSADCFRSMAMQLLADDHCGVVGIRLMYPGGREVQHGGVKVTHHLMGSGYYVIGHSQGAHEFVHDERVAFGVTFACAMTRRSTFDLLGGLEEVMMPNAFGDVDFCARAVEAGFRNYYFGTLEGTHGESKTRGRSAEEVEFAALHGRHGRTFADWRLRDLAHGEGYTWPLVAVPPGALAPIPAPDPPPAPPLPLRYRLADRANGALKLALGPIHGALRHGLAAPWRSPRVPKAGPGEATEGAVGRPHLLRRERSRRT